MSVYAVTYKATKPSIEIVERCLNAYKIPHKITNIPQYSLSSILTSGRLFAIFGQTLARQLPEREDKEYFLFPEPDKLLNTSDNTEYRQQAAQVFEKLKARFEDIEQETQKAIQSRIDLIKTEVLDEVTTEQLVCIHELADGDQYRYVINPDGNRVEICATPEGFSDLNCLKLTIGEFILFKHVCKTFSVNQVKIESID